MKNKKTKKLKERNKEKRMNNSQKSNITMTHFGEAIHE